MTDRTRWRDPRSRRGAIVRLALFVPLYLALEYLLSLIFFAAAGKSVNGAAEFLSASATLAAAVIAGCVLLTTIDQRRAGALGFAWTRRTPREIVEGFGVGGGALAVAALLLLATGSLTYVAQAGTAVQWLHTVLVHLSIFAIAGAAEEAVFRGYGFQALARAFGPVVATVGTSALFAFAHTGNPNVTGFALLNIFLAGVLLGLAYLRTMSLWFATAVHVGWNWTMASLFDLPVSGLAMFQTPMYEPVTKGNAWLSGGTFGPEGGLAGTIGMLIGFMALAWLVRVRPAPEMVELRPIALDTADGERKNE